MTNDYLPMAAVDFDTDEFTRLLFSDFFFEAAGITFGLTLAAMFFGIILGLFGALGRMSRFWPARFISGGYLWVFRGTPLLVQIVFWYDGTAELTDGSLNLAAMTAGLIALSVNEGAYMTEIVRAGLISVDEGQHEAAKALGMRWTLKMRRIIIPQAVRIILPPTGNEFINMLKNTSLLFVIAVPELFSTASGVFSTNFRYFETLTVVSIWYLILTSILTFALAKLEHHFSYERMNVGRDTRGAVSRMFGLGGRVER